MTLDIHSNTMQAIDVDQMDSNMQEERKKTTGPYHNAKYKAKMCKNWVKSGTCPYNEKCQFAHGSEEMKKWAEMRKQQHEEKIRKLQRKLEKQIYPKLHEETQHMHVCSSSLHGPQCLHASLHPQCNRRCSSVQPMLSCPCGESSCVDADIFRIDRLSEEILNDRTHIIACQHGTSNSTPSSIGSSSFQGSPIHSSVSSISSSRSSAFFTPSVSFGYSRPTCFSECSSSRRCSTCSVDEENDPASYTHEIGPTPWFHQHSRSWPSTAAATSKTPSSMISQEQSEHLFMHPGISPSWPKRRVSSKDSLDHRSQSPFFETVSTLHRSHHPHQAHRRAQSVSGPYNQFSTHFSYSFDDAHRAGSAFVSDDARIGDGQVPPILAYIQHRAASIQEDTTSAPLLY